MRKINFLIRNHWSVLTEARSLKAFKNDFVNFFFSPIGVEPDPICNTLSVTGRARSSFSKARYKQSYGLYDVTRATE